LYLENAKKGSFVIRDSSRGPGCLVISLIQTPKILHLLVQRDKKGHFMLDPDAWKDHTLGTETFSALQLLIARLQQFGMVNDGLSKADLKNISSELDQKKKGVSTPASKDKDHSQKAVEKVTSDSTSLRKEKSTDSEEEIKKAMMELEAEAEYKGMLSAMVIDNKLTASKVANLDEFRKKHNISSDQHTKVLKSLGLTQQQFDNMRSKAEKNDDTSDNSNDCTICMARPRQIAFMTCGHVATCVQCSQGLSDCPICRKPVTGTMRIFT